MKIITVSCIAKREKRNELIELSKSMIIPSRAESGCIHYSFYQDLDDGDKFLFYEEWKDQASIDIHNSTNHFLEFQPRFKTMIEGEPTITIHSVN